LKVLVVYDTASPTRNTEKVAQTISEVLKEKGFEVDCKYVNDVDPATVKDYDCLLAGAPTHAFRATKPLMQFLDKLSQNELSGKLGTAFGTQLQGRLTGSAAKGIEKKLQSLGLRIVAPPLVTYVEGKLEIIHLKDGEIEKIRKYAEDLAKGLQT
jgi:flavodoxin